MPKNRAVQKPAMEKALVKRIGQYAITLSEKDGRKLNVYGHSDYYSFGCQMTIIPTANGAIVNYNISIDYNEDDPNENNNDGEHWCGTFRYPTLQPLQTLQHKNLHQPSQINAFNLADLATFLRVNYLEMLQKS